MICPHCFSPTDDSRNRCIHCRKLIEHNKDDDSVTSSVFSDDSLSLDSNHTDYHDDDVHSDGDSKWMRIKHDAYRDAHDYCKCPEDDHGNIQHTPKGNATSSHSPSHQNDPSQEPSPDAEALQQVNTYLYPTIITSLLCCLFPSGVMSIYHMVKTMGCKGRGDLSGALLHSRKTKNWITASVALSVIFWLIALITNK